MLITTGLYSLVPLVIHRFATDVNPFIFGTVAYGTLSIVLMAYLRIRISSAFRHDFESMSDTEEERVTFEQVLRFSFGLEDGARPRHMLRCLLRVGRPHAGINKPTHVDALSGSAIGHIMDRIFRPQRTIPWLAFPLVWLTVTRLDYAFFVFSARYIETAVSTTLFEIWPIVMVIVLARVSVPSVDTPVRRISRRKRVLMLVGFGGLAIVILTQSEFSVQALLQSSSVIGIMLAAISGTLAGISPAAGIRYGDVMYSYHAAERRRASDDSTAVDPAKSGDHVAENREALDQYRASSQNLWFAILGLALSCVLAVPLNLLFAFIVPVGSDQPFRIGLEWVGAAVGLGIIVFGIGSIATRQANLDSRDLGVNSLFFMTPILSLLWLSFAGISLHRPDILWIGGALVFSMNGLIESNPDEEPDYTKIDSDRPWGTRLGFTSLIMSLWTFGTVVYLRDEVLPASWLSWSGSEYWTLVSLSATVFALIFGFRVARLTSRLVEEDRQMLETFRGFERLVRSQKLPEDTLLAVRRFDTANPRNVATTYNLLRTRLRDGFLESPNDADAFFKLQDELDGLAHSKQQGKDFSELISIFVFAGITIALGLMARPSDTAWPVAGWTGFLTETFTALLVSVIVFLAFHLVDMRRDRQIPLIVPIEDTTDEYGLFFRYRSDIMFANLVSVLLILFMAAVFGSLLYFKWL